MKALVLLLVFLVLGGCRVTGGRWVEEDVAVRCPGGRIEQVRRTTDTHLGRTRHTILTTNACLE